MPPVKFGDVEKVAKDVLDEDHHVKGFQLKNKAKTNWDGAVVTTTMDLGAHHVNEKGLLQKLEAKLEGVKPTHTPTKLSWKFPSPFGIKGFSIDKLELSPEGKYKMETSFTEGSHTVKDLKVEAKSDLVNLPKSTVHCTYTGIKDTFIMMDTTPMSMDKSSIEVSRAFGPATVATKIALASYMAPDFGCRFLHGPFFGALKCLDKFSTYTAFCMYKASPVLSVAATYQYGGKASGSGGVGVQYQANADTRVKAKVLLDQSVLCTVKHAFAKGFTVLGGFKYNVAKGDSSYGLQVSIE